MKTALLAATTLITLAASSQAGPSWKEVLRDVAVASVAPQQAYVVRQGYCNNSPQMIHYVQPVHRCREVYSTQPVVVQNVYGQRVVVPARW